VNFVVGRSVTTSAPIGYPFNWNCTPATSRSSSDTVAGLRATACLELLCLCWLESNGCWNDEDLRHVGPGRVDGVQGKLAPRREGAGGEHPDRNRFGEGETLRQLEGERHGANPLYRKGRQLATTMVVSLAARPTW